MTEDQEEDLRQAFLAAGPKLRRRLRGLLPQTQMRLGDVTLHLDPRDNYTDLQLWLHGIPPEAQSLAFLIEAVAGKRAVVFDIGANCGVFTVPLAQAAGSGSLVHAFEPNPLMVGRLGRNVLENGLGHRVRIQACALGADRSEAELRLRRGNLGQASLNPDAPAKAPGFVVPVRPLRPYLAEIPRYETSVLKIDVEGSEEAALGPWLDDADAPRPKVVLIETRHAALWQRDLVQDLIRLGYHEVFEAEGNTVFSYA